MRQPIAAVPAKAPLALHAVRGVLLVWGLLAVVGMIDAMVGLSFVVPIGVLNIFSGTLVLRGSRSW